MNRHDLQHLSRTRAREAKVLLDTGLFAGSYYLMGYAVECAIKAAIAKQTKRYDFPDLDRARDSYKHSLEQLLKTAGLSQTLEAARHASLQLDENWAVVKDWSQDARYMLSIPESHARDLHIACMATTHGLLRWLKNFW